jgi:hypothetical protein
MHGTMNVKFKYVVILYAIKCNDPDACRGDMGFEEEKEEKCTATLRTLMQ